MSPTTRGLESIPQGILWVLTPVSLNRDFSRGREVLINKERTGMCPLAAVLQNSRPQLVWGPSPSPPCTWKWCSQWLFLETRAAYNLSLVWFTHSHTTGSSLECWCNRGFWETVFHRVFALLHSLQTEVVAIICSELFFWENLGSKRPWTRKIASPLGAKLVRFVYILLQKRWGFLILWFFCYNTTRHDFTCYLLPFISLWGSWNSENWYSKILLLWPLLLLFASQTQKSAIFGQHPRNSGRLTYLLAKSIKSHTFTVLAVDTWHILVD